MTNAVEEKAELAERERKREREREREGEKDYKERYSINGGQYKKSGDHHTSSPMRWRIFDAS